MKLVTLALVALAAPAHAEGERALSASLGWAWFSTPGKAKGNQAPPDLSPDAGGALAVSYEHAIGTDLALRGEIAGGIFYGGTQKMKKAESAVSFAGVGDVGAVFRFDVLKYVPYAFAGIGGVVAGGGPIDKGADYVLVIGGGVDWLASRDRSYGLEARIASFAGNTTVVTFGLRGTVRWGYF